MKYVWKIPLLLLASSLAAGCSTREMYEAVRQNERSTCDQEFADTERAKCLARTQDDYDTYSEKRRAVTEDQATEARR